MHFCHLKQLITHIERNSTQISIYVGTVSISIKSNLLFIKGILLRNISKHSLPKNQ